MIIPNIKCPLCKKIYRWDIEAETFISSIHSKVVIREGELCEEASKLSSGFTLKIYTCSDCGGTLGFMECSAVGGISVHRVQ